MKYLRLFKIYSEAQSATIFTPNVCLVDGDLYYNFNPNELVS